MAAGDITYDNVHKAVFGFNQGQEGRHLLSEETKVCKSFLHSMAARCMYPFMAKVSDLSVIGRRL